MEASVDEQSKPSIYLTSKELPVIKGWKVGGKYTLKMDVEQTSVSKNRDGLLSAVFEVNSVDEESEDD